MIINAWSYHVLAILYMFLWCQTWQPTMARPWWVGLCRALTVLYWIGFGAMIFGSLALSSFEMHKSLATQYFKDGVADWLPTASMRCAMIAHGAGLLYAFAGMYDRYKHRAAEGAAGSVVAVSVANETSGATR
jgi:hypothetical protein